MKNIEYKSTPKLSSWRKISLGSWKPKGDSSIYTFEEIEVSNVLKHSNSKNISLQSFIIKALSLTIEENEKINSVIRFGKIYRRKHISVFSHILPNINNDDLSGIKINEAQNKSLEEVNNEFNLKLQNAKTNDDLFFKSKKNFKYVPAFFSKVVLDFLSFIMYSLNFYSKNIPSPKDPFGSVMLTNIGSLGITKALCPIAPYTKIPMVISIGKTEIKPWIINNEISKATIITFGFTFDHRIMDGVHYASFIKSFKSFFVNPKSIL